MVLSRQTSKHLSPRLAQEQVVKERHFKMCGEVVWEWNELHRSFGYVFSVLLGENNFHVSNAIWHTPTSDKGQRDLLKTAVEWADGVRQPHRERVIWAIEQADKLSTYRNDIVHGHGGFLIDEGGLTTHLSTGKNSFKRVMKHARVDTPLHELMAALCDDLRKLQYFIDEVRRCMRPIEGKAKRSKAGAK